MDDEIKQILMNHESRITRLETEVRNMNTWMKSIDRKLDDISNDLAYLKGRFNEFRNNEKEVRRLNVSWRGVVLHMLSAIIGGIIVLIGDILSRIQL